MLTHYAIHTEGTVFSGSKTGWASSRVCRTLGFAFKYCPIVFNNLGMLFSEARGRLMTVALVVTFFTSAHRLPAKFST